MNKKLTLVIPFRNEGRQVYKTIRNICSYSSSELFDVICIDDCSDDGYDYAGELGGFPNVSLFRNPSRLGVAGSRDKGVFMASTPYVLILDGHMRIFRDVLTPLIGYLEQYPRTLFCLQTRVMKEESGRIYIDKRMPVNRAARIRFDIGKPAELFNPVWERLGRQDYLSGKIDVPCVYGADYATRRDYYLYLHGLNGLAQYGCDEPLLSVKVWLEGGRCCLLRELEIAHLYRKKSPCGITGKAVLYNRMLCAELLFPEELKAAYFRGVSASPCFAELKKLLDNMKAEIREEHDYLDGIFTRDFSDILKLNEPDHANRTYPQ